MFQEEVLHNAVVEMYSNKDVLQRIHCKHKTVLAENKWCSAIKYTSIVSWN